MNADTPAVTAALRSCEVIGLDELGEADLQRRTDVKYLVTLDQLAELAPALAAGHRVLTVDGLRAFDYRSSYLDTPDLACFHAHRQGRRLRWKARTRLYADSGRCRFEVKLKTGRGDTDKHALVLTSDRYGTAPAEGLALLQVLLRDRYGVAAPDHLVPGLEVSHRRTTLVGPEKGSRVTLDSDLGFRATDGRRGALNLGTVLVETKSADGRGPADLLLRSAGIRPSSVSKYAVGTALTCAGVPDQPWRGLIRRTFTDVQEDAA